MRVLVVGAGGQVGTAASAAFAAHGHEVIEASRRGAFAVDLTSEDSISGLYRRVGPVDAVVSCTGSVPFKPFAELRAEDFQAGFSDKVMGQVNLVRLGLEHVSDGGSFTLTTGVLAREPIPTGVAASLANGALEAFVMAAAVELPRGLRLNAVSPSVLEDAPGYHPFFPGFTQIASDELGQAYVKSAAGIQSGKVFVLG